MLESVKILCRNEDEDPEQNDRGDVRAHVRAILGAAAIPFEFREVEHAQDVLGPYIVSGSSLVSRSLAKRDDISSEVLLSVPHLAPRMTIRVAINVSMIRPDLKRAFVKFPDRWRNSA
ncbi:hypothetical protein NLM31_13290 [Bradyrhizobium sp. CCGUVB4N]|uniref:hypothetical protein n=1 Tax=Bradyrhizobium sp. CCGUVB4N TaxID=2949631 RepID=UPI0020B2ED86|nr:hypothetical protein [Bradyrhizobium sp. CCGUVB4N]MCP3381315.1 hypothetical protein [Bradyrhizobium sp. CCGUVB4N]